MVGLERIHDPWQIQDWLAQARLPWNPVTAAERQFDSLAVQGDESPGVAAFDHLDELAARALLWLEENPCPDTELGGRFIAKMTAYRALTDAMRVCHS